MKSITTYITEKMVYTKATANKIIFVRNIKELKSLIIETNDKFSLTNISFEEYEDDIVQLHREFRTLIKTQASVIDVSNWVFGNKVYSISDLFAQNYNVKEIIGLDTWDVSNINNFSGLFDRCNNLESIKGIENWNTSNAITLSGIFSNCQSLTSLNLSNWDVSKSRYASLLFGDCIKLKEIKGLNKWNTNEFYSCGLMFRNCSSLEKLDLSNWKMDKVQNMNGMFCDCNNLMSIGDVSNWDVSNVKDMSEMFYNCGNLECDCSNWKLHIRCKTNKLSTYTSRRIFRAPKRNIKI